MQQRRPFSRAFPVGIALGLVFSSFYALAHPDRIWQILAGGATTGAFISVAIHLLEGLTGSTTDRLPVRWRVAAKALLYLVGSLSGWILGMLLSSVLFGFGVSISQLLKGGLFFTMGVTGMVAVVVGLSFYAYEVLEGRLAATIEQLKESEFAEKELHLARSIQSRLLPPSLIEGDGFTIAARNLPASFVAGDFYDVVRLEDGTIVIVVADVAGKGVGASLTMASVKAVLPFVAREAAPHAMSVLNEKLVRELGRREFVALAYVRYQPLDGTIELLNAGFPEPWIVGVEGACALATTGERLPLGIRAGAQYLSTSATLRLGERLVFVSDGIPEAPADGEPLGYDRVATMLTAVPGGLHGEPWLDGFLNDVRATVDDGLSDDWTAVVLERT